MNGPQHYQAAEELIERANGWSDDDHQLATLDFAEAQVHATLALAAAVALGTQRLDDHGMGPADSNAWIAVASADEGLAATAAQLRAEATADGAK